MPIFASTRAPAELGAYGGVPLGASDEVGATTHRRRVPPGTRIVLYTDGLTEYSRSPIDGERRLLAAVDSLVATSRDASARWLRDTVVGDVTATDDIAVLVLAIEPGGFVAETASFGWRFHSSDAATAQRSRREIASRLGELSSARLEALADAELIVGELLANTVEHAPGLVSIDLRRTGHDVVLVVEDSGPGLPAVPPVAGDGLSEDGRGLFLVRTLARDVSFVRSAAGGTLVRVVLPLGIEDALEAAS